MEADNDAGFHNTCNPHSKDNSENQMETSFSTLKSEPRMDAVDQLSYSTYTLTDMSGCRSATAASNQPYESNFGVKEEVVEVNYGAKGDEDGGDVNI